MKQVRDKIAVGLREAIAVAHGEEKPARLHVADSPDMTATEEQAWDYLCRASVDFESQFFTAMRAAHLQVAQSHEPTSFTITLTPRTS